MIEKLRSYKPADTIPFSREVYDAVFIDYSTAIWPAQGVWLILSALLVFCCLSQARWAARLLAILLATAWLFIGIVFHQGFFLSINWSAQYLALLCGVEALGFLLLAVFSKGVVVSITRPVEYLIASLLVLTLFVPIPALWTGDWQEVALFGWGPTPTAIGTLALLLLAKGRFSRMLLSIIPLLWCVCAAFIAYGAR